MLLPWPPLEYAAGSQFEFELEFKLGYERELEPEPATARLNASISSSTRCAALYFGDLAAVGFAIRADPFDRALLLLVLVLVLVLVWCVDVDVNGVVEGVSEAVEVVRAHFVGCCSIAARGGR